MEMMTVFYYESDDGSVIMHDPREHDYAGRLVEPVMEEGPYVWRQEADLPPLPYSRWREKVYRLQKVDLLCTERGRPVFEQHPESIRRMLERRARRSIRNQIRGSLA